MADAKICDRCGEFYKESNVYGVKNPYISFSRDDFDDDRSVDLCPDCQESFNEWYRMDNTKKAINM